jgi:parallel beta helix pectate lyase-like protein
MRPSAAIFAGFGIGAIGLAGLWVLPNTTDSNGAGTAVTIATTDNAQAVIDANPPGTTFDIAAGVHPGWRVVPRSDDVFVGAPGAVLDGENNTDVAFIGTYGSPPPSNVTIEGTAGNDLLIQNYNNGGSQLADSTVEAGHGGQVTSGWSLNYVEIANNFSTGIGMGNNMTVNNCYVHDNGRLGIGSPFITGSVIENSVIDHNAWHLVGPGPGFQAGGIKTVAQGDAMPSLVIQDNDISNNGWNGVWTDVGSSGVIVNNNTIENNAHDGVHFEISSDQLAENNTIQGNQGSAVAISGSQVIVIAQNSMLNNNSGVEVGGWTRPPGLNDVFVVGNSIANSGMTGGPDNPPGNIVISFSANAYSGNDYFDWEGQRLTLAQWQSLGFD